MTEILSKLGLYLQYSFVQYALIVGVLIALCSSLLGVTLVLKRYSQLGSGLSHVAFCAMCVAAVLRMTNEMPVVLPVTVACAVLLLIRGQRAKVSGDAAVAVLSVSALALGYLVMNRFSTSSNLSADVCTTLFGSTSILTLTLSEVWLSIALSIAVVVVFCVFYQKIFSVTFDESFSQTVGINTGLMNLIIAVMAAVIIVLAMNLVGSLLITALIIFPALSAMRLFGSFRSVTVFSVVISVVGALLGILISVAVGTPVGSTIVIADLVIYGICTCIGMISGGRN